MHGVVSTEDRGNEEGEDGGKLTDFSQDIASVAMDRRNIMVNAGSKMVI